jgi:hypothetical protein
MGSFLFFWGNRFISLTMIGKYGLLENALNLPTDKTHPAHQSVLLIFPSFSNRFISHFLLFFPEYQEMNNDGVMKIDQLKIHYLSIS